MRIDVNDKDLTQRFKSLTSKEFDKAEKKALKAAGKVFSKEGRSLMKLRVKNVTKNNPKYNDKMIAAIRATVKEADTKDQMMLNYHTLGSGKSGSGTFRARFLENDTKERKNKKSDKSYGKITGRKFFKDSVTNKRQEATNVLTKNLMNNINDIWENKKI